MGLRTEGRIFPISVRILPEIPHHPCCNFRNLRTDDHNFPISVRILPEIPHHSGCNFRNLRTDDHKFPISVRILPEIPHHPCCNFRNLRTDDHNFPISIRILPEIPHHSGCNFIKKTRHPKSRMPGLKYSHVKYSRYEIIILPAESVPFCASVHGNQQSVPACEFLFLHRKGALQVP